MNLIDMHCDTLWRLTDLQKKGNLMDNDCSVSIPFMRRAGTLAQFFACFTYLENYTDLTEEGGKNDGKKGGYEKCYEHVLEMLDYMEEQMKLFCDVIAPALSCRDIFRNESEGRISAVLTVEEGGIINDRIERLRTLYDRGVRLITPMWNYENCIGYPNSRNVDIMRRGLKPLGIEVVEEMSRLGIIVDVSHASDGTFHDILRYVKGPVIASHSNCRALCSHPRNLSDEMIHALAEKGGAAGLNFYGCFLGTQKESKIDEMTAHILHMIQKGGSGFPVIGTDFDGFDGMEHMDIPDVSFMGRLWEALRKKGLSESQLENIWNKNALRIVEEICG